MLVFIWSKVQTFDNTPALMHLLHRARQSFGNLICITMREPTNRHADKQHRFYSLDCCNARLLEEGNITGLHTQKAYTHSGTYCLNAYPTLLLKPPRAYMHFNAHVHEKASMGGCCTHSGRIYLYECTPFVYVSL